MAESETIDYFDLIVECAKVVMANKPDHLTGKAYWRKRIQVAWHELNSYMSSPLPEVHVGTHDAFQARLGELLAALARESSMAAWYFGIQAEDGEDNPEVVAQQLTDMAVKAKVRL